MNRIKREIHYRGWTQVEVADRMGITYPALYKKLKDPMNIKLRDLCQIFDVKKPWEATQLTYVIREIIEEGLENERI